MNKKVDLNGQFLIIDSFPVPVCQPIRNYRAKIFRGYANIGYKATKKIYFYGFKVHAIVSDDGYILDYVVTKASVHDARETVELMENTHPSNYYLLGDEGYLGKELHQQLKQRCKTLSYQKYGNLFRRRIFLHFLAYVKLISFHGKILSTTTSS